MSRARKLLLGVGVVVSALAAGWFALDAYISLPPRIAPDVFKPDHPTGQMAVSSIRRNLDSFAAARHEPDAFTFVRNILDAFGRWPIEEKDDEDDGDGEVELRAILKAADRFIGRAGFVYAGFWQDEGGETYPGVVALTRADTLLKWRAGSFARLIFGKGSMGVEAHADLKLYHRIEEEAAMRLSLFNAEGWVVLVYEAGAGRLAPLVAHRATHSSRQTTAKKSADDDWEHRFISLGLHPKMLPEFLSALFPADEEGRIKKRRRGEESASERFARAMEGIEELDLTVRSPVIPAVSGALSKHLEIRRTEILSLMLKGPRIAEDAAALARADACAVLPIEKSVVPVSALSPAILQMDFSASFAKGGSDMLGLNWDEILDEARDFDWVRPELLDSLARLLGHDSQVAESPNARIGFALYPTLAETIPVAAVWEDHPPLVRTQNSPADAWRMMGEGADSLAMEQADSFKLMGDPLYTSFLPEGMIEARRNLHDQLWADGPAPPLAFIAVNFDELLESMLAFPAIVLKGDDRDRWLQWRDTAEGFQKTVGSFALRADREGDAIHVRFRLLDDARIRGE